MAYVRRRIIERKLKEMILEEARRRGVDPRDLAEWAYYAAGVKVRRTDWDEVVRAILRSDDITAQELAAYLYTEHGLEIDENRWVEVLRSFSLADKASKLWGGKLGKKEGKS